MQYMEYILCLSGCMFTAVIHSWRSGGERKNNVLTEHKIVFKVLPLPLDSGIHFLYKHNQGRFIS